MTNDGWLVRRYQGAWFETLTVSNPIMSGVSPVKEPPFMSRIMYAIRRVYKAIAQKLSNFSDDFV
jgi:hypothetical protein